MNNEKFKHIQNILDKKMDYETHIADIMTCDNDYETSVTFYSLQHSAYIIIGNPRHTYYDCYRGKIQMGIPILVHKYQPMKFFNTEWKFGTLMSATDDAWWMEADRLRFLNMFPIRVNNHFDGSFPTARKL